MGATSVFNAEDAGIKVGTLEVHAVPGTSHNLIIKSSVDVGATFTDANGKKKGIPPLVGGMPLVISRAVRLGYRNIHSGWALGALLDVKGNPVAFVEGFKAFGVDPGVVHKHIRAVFLLDEAVPF